MKITGLKATPVSVPSGRRGGNQTSVIVEVNTDDGYVGISAAPNPLGAEVTRTILDSSKQLIIGKDPFQIEPIKKRLYGHYNLTHLHIHAGNWAVYGVEAALWDIVGKACNQPLHRLWGGAFRTKISYYGNVSSSRILKADRKKGLETIANESAARIKQGYTTLYMKIGFDPDDDVEAVKTMREVAGYGRIKIRVDPNQAWSPGEAIQIINRMAKYDLEFVDQPVLMYNLDDLARVRKAVKVPIASHESSWTMYNALNLIKAAAADVIHIDPRFDAGFSGARITAGMAEAAGLPVVLHSFGQLGITEAAHMHVVASCPNFIYANQTSYDSLQDDVIKGGKIKFEAGCMDLPMKPGIGVELDGEKVQKYAKNYEENVKKQDAPSGSGDDYALMGYRRYFGQ